METLELFLQDLTEESQKKLIDFFGDNGNYDIFPLVILEKYEDEE